MKEIIIAIIGSGTLTALITALVNYKIHNKESNDLLNKGVMALLGMQIRNQCQSAIQRGNITIEELEQIQEMNVIYKSLNGNGFIKTLMEKVENLKIVND